ncbi:MAG: choice-of-anchor Q domain-containing protein [Bacteroidota bacterium]
MHYIIFEVYSGPHFEFSRIRQAFLRGIVLGLFISIGFSCRKDFEYAPSTGNLEFSRDTVYLDTIFSNIGSSTYSLKVYNRTKEDMLIPSIRLGQGQQSDYRLNVDGAAGKEFLDIPILARDSLYIFVETTHTIENQEESVFLYTDVIEFDSGGFLQEVQLVTLVQDAIFLFPSLLADGTSETITVGADENAAAIRVEGFFLTEEQLRFTAEKPYVIYGYAAVPEEGTLIMDAGTRVYFHRDSGIFVSDGGSIQVNGTLSNDPKIMENEVIFEGDRLEPEFSDIPGQWGTVWLASGSRDNIMEYLTIKNATVGLLVEGNGVLDAPTLTFKNSQIHNSVSHNLWARSARIVAENTVLGSAGGASLFCNAGGDYTFAHATIANYWTNGFRQGTALQIDNFVQDNASDLVRATFDNCIIDGNAAIELSLVDNGTHLFNTFFDHCLIQFQDTNGVFSENPLYNFENPDLYNRILLNQNADFGNPPRNDFSLGPDSAARDNGNPEIAQTVPLDIRGIDRLPNPDRGAYESAIPE